MEFALKVILSFIVGGGFVSGVVWVSEKFGAKIGAALAGTPTTILVSLIFIAITEGSDTIQQTISVIPVLIVAALFYSLVFVYAASKTAHAQKYLLATVLAAAAWTVFALIARYLFTDVHYVVTLGAALLQMALFRRVFKGFSDKSPDKTKNTVATYAMRFMVAGSIVAISVIAARMLGPTWGGLASSFPVLTGSSLYFLSMSQGLAFTKGWLAKLPVAYIGVLIFLTVLYAAVNTWPLPLSFLASVIASSTYSYAYTQRKTA